MAIKVHHGADPFPISMTALYSGRGQRAESDRDRMDRLQQAERDRQLRLEMQRRDTVSREGMLEQQLDSRGELTELGNQAAMDRLNVGNQAAMDRLDTTQEGSLDRMDHAAGIASDRAREQADLEVETRKRVYTQAQKRRMGEIETALDWLGQNKTLPQAAKDKKIAELMLEQHNISPHGVSLEDEPTIESEMAKRVKVDKKDGSKTVLQPNGDIDIHKADNSAAVKAAEAAAKEVIRIDKIRENYQKRVETVRDKSYDRALKATTNIRAEELKREADDVNGKFKARSFDEILSEREAIERSRAQDIPVPREILEEQIAAREFGGRQPMDRQQLKQQGRDRFVNEGGTSMQSQTEQDGAYDIRVAATEALQTAYELIKGGADKVRVRAVEIGVDPNKVGDALMQAGRGDRAALAWLVKYGFIQGGN